MAPLELGQFNVLVYICFTRVYSVQYYPVPLSVWGGSAFDVILTSDDGGNGVAKQDQVCSSEVRVGYCDAVALVIPFGCNDGGLGVPC